MQVNSISSFSCCQPRRVMNDTPNPVPQPAPAPQPETSEEKKSIYFGSNSDDSNKSVRGMRKAGMLIALTPAALGALVGLNACTDEPSYSSSSSSSSGTAIAIAGGCCGKGDTVRDTVYIDRTKFDTVYVDTGSYHVTHDTIIQWKDNYVRPIPLDTLMKNLSSWGIDGTAGANIFDGNTNRNIIHYVGTREWEYNNREIGDMDVLNSSKNVLIYNTEIQDYKGRHLSYGKTVFRIPTSSFTLKTEDGKVLNSPKGFFVETYKNPSNNQNVDILDCEREQQFFCQTDSKNNVIRVYSKNEDGYFVEDGSASKGYLTGSTILLKNLIGRYDTDDHFVDVHVSTVDDETLKDLYVRRRDDAEAANH